MVVLFQNGTYTIKCFKKIMKFTEVRSFFYELKNKKIKKLVGIPISPGSLETWTSLINGVRPPMQSMNHVTTRIINLKFVVNSVFTNDFMKLRLLWWCGTYDITLYFTNVYTIISSWNQNHFDDVKHGHIIISTFLIHHVTIIKIKIK